MLKQLLVTLAFLAFAAAAFAQTDTVRRDTAVIKNVKDTIPARVAPSVKAAPVKKKREAVYHPDSTHIPSLAVKRSLMVPGWGQIYNRKIWKVPLIYGGLGALGYSVVYNQKYYKQFLALARIKSTGGIPSAGQPYYAEYVKYKNEYNLYGNVSYQSLADASDFYQRNRALSILGFIAVWGIQAIDAYIDAKFISSYTVDDDLSFKVTPALIGQPMYASNFNSAIIPGIKITFTL
jgi:hypothetical protein